MFTDVYKTCSIKNDRLGMR